MSTMIKALGLVLLVAGASAYTLKADGSSAAKAMLLNNVPGFIAPETFTYLAGGTGAGRNFINYTLPVDPATSKGPLAFGDEAFPAAAPTGVVQLPIAIGSIAFFVNLGVPLPAGFALTADNLCTIFSGKATTWDLINAALPATPVTVVRRSDSSGSTAVVEDYLTKVCRFSVQPLVAPTPGAIVGASGTSGVLAAMSATSGSIGYAVCGSTAANIVEAPVVGGAGSIVTCQTADYSGYVIAAPKAPLFWSSVKLVAGTKANQYPTAYLLFAYARASVTVATDFVAEAYFAKKALLGLTTQTFQQGALKAAFYSPLPLTAMSTITCKGINALKVAVPAGYTALPVPICPAP